MPSKLRALLERVQGLVPALKKSLVLGRLVEWALIFAVIGIVAAACGVAGLFILRPIDEQRPLIVEKLRAVTGARKFSIGHLSWTFSMRSLAAGLKASEVSIEGLGSLESVDLPELEFRLQPLKFIFGRLPLNVESTGGLAVISPRVASAEGKKVEAEPEGPVKALPLPRWMLKGIAIDVELSELNIKVDPKGLGFDPANSVLNLVKSEIHGRIAGVPGSFNGDFECELNVDLADGRYVAQGPFGMHAIGDYDFHPGHGLEFKTEKFEIEINDANAAAFGLFEKTANENLEFESELEVSLGPDLGVKAAEIKEGVFTYDELKTDVTAFLNEEGAAGLKWNLPRTEARSLNVPIVFVREHPMWGVIESSGAFSIPRGGRLEGNWKFLVNNFVADASTLVGVADKASKGKVNLSFVTEGTAKGGVFSSPRTELHLDGSEAQMEFMGGRFVKPAGDAFELFMKARIHDDRLDMDRFKADFNTLTVESIASLSGLSTIREKPGRLKVEVNSNRVDLAQWSSYFLGFGKVPLRGLAQFSGGLEGPLDLSSKDPYKDLSWHVNALNLFNIRGAFDKEATLRFGVDDRYRLDGPFAGDFLFNGRGVGSSVDRAGLRASLKLDKFNFMVGNFFHKPPGVPFSLDIDAQQSRNELTVNKGHLHLHDLELDFRGGILQGSKRSSIALAMPRPVDLAGWNRFFLTAPQVPWNGRVQWNGRVGFSAPGAMAGGLDWKKISLEGNLNVGDLTGKLEGFKNPVRNGRGRLALSGEGLTVPDFAFDMGGARASLSGKLVRKGASSKGGVPLMALLNPKDLSVDARLSLNRLKLEDFASDLPPPKKAPNVTEDDSLPISAQIQSLLGRPYIKGNAFKLGLIIDEGEAGPLPFKELNARTTWNGSQLRLEPLSVRVMDGKLKGSAIFDAGPWYRGRESPQISASLAADSVDLGVMAHLLKPAMEKLVGGRLDGSLVMSGSGFDPDEIIRRSKGRLAGRVTEGRFETLQVLQGPIDSLFKNSAARDYLMKEASSEKCLQKSFKAAVDVQLSNGRVEIQKGDVSFEAGSDLELKGSLDRELNVDLAGDFVAGAACVGGDVRACLAGSDGRARIPYRITGKASEAKPVMDYDAVAKRVVACATKQVARRAEAEVKKIISSPAAQDAEKKGLERLKKIFQ